MSYRSLLGQGILPSGSSHNLGILTRGMLPFSDVVSVGGAVIAVFAGLFQGLAFPPGRVFSQNLALGFSRAYSAVRGEVKQAMILKVNLPARVANLAAGFEKKGQTAAFEPKENQLVVTQKPKQLEVNR